MHISDLAVLGLDPVGRNETANRAMLDQQIRDWCGRTDSHLTVQPVIDLNDHNRTDAYEVRGRFETRNHLLNSTCVFPMCTRPACECDHDHRVPRERGGETCDCNIAPLCRRHHRLKTHAGWRYTLVEPGVWLWSDPHGQQFVRDATGTLDVTPPDRPVNRRSPDNGCRAGP
ncbi:HNH endonuclease signature motif containing protein [Nocardioides sp.]|uniref:HNH endonuclease signature motif containing protein n=1 Tax=Nocardioides sp. TaxID=35761 RepID=UPI002ED07FDE